MLWLAGMVSPNGVRSTVNGNGKNRNFTPAAQQQIQRLLLTVSGLDIGSPSCMDMMAVKA
jgi:hypothetical protein